MYAVTAQTVSVPVDGQPVSWRGSDGTDLTAFEVLLYAIPDGFTSDNCQWSAAATGQRVDGGDGGVVPV